MFFLKPGMLFAAACAVLMGCHQPIAGKAVEYREPARQQDLRNTRQVSAGYDATWTGLIDHVARPSFTIDAFEKESGLLTLRFGETDIARFVDCGIWLVNGRSQPYAGRTDQGLRLNGRMNIRVQERAAGYTDVRIDSLYVLRNDSGSVWQFTTNDRSVLDVGNPATGTVPRRTCQSSHEAERRILTGIEAVAETR